MGQTGEFAASSLIVRQAARREQKRTVPNTLPLTHSLAISMHACSTQIPP